MIEGSIGTKLASPPEAEGIAEGIRRPTIEDVARYAGVSRGTVSRVLNGGQHVHPATMEKVLHAVDELGYSVNQAARNLAAGRTGSVAFVISERHTHLFGDPNFGLFVRVFSRELRRDGRHLLVTTAADYKEEHFLADYLVAGHVDGAIFGLPRAGEKLFERLLRVGLPVVTLGRPLGYEEQLSWVAVDDKAGASKAVERLLSRGRRQIATITGPLNTSSGRERLEGYLAALGIDRASAHMAEGDWTLESGHRAARKLLKDYPDLDGLFVASDLMAMGAVTALREAGRGVPDEIAVVGFDDSVAARMVDPPLTTIHQPFERLALEAVRILYELMANRASGPYHVILPTRLVQRRSA
jgi:DNA-binding LacI/PurR family transcriptional regulator